MANTATRGSLRTRVRQLADQVNSQFLDDTEINAWLDIGLSKLHDLLVTHFEDYFETQRQIILIPNQSDYPLPDDFYKLQGVDLFIGTIRYVVPRFMNRERNRRQSQALTFISDLQYRIIGNLIRFIPTPTAAFPVILYYAPQYIELANDNTLVEQVIPQGWEEYAVLEAAIRSMIKEESDPSALLALQNQIVANLERAADDRDANEPNRVTDVSRRFTGRLLGTFNGDEWGDW